MMLIRRFLILVLPLCHNYLVTTITIRLDDNFKDYLAIRKQHYQVDKQIKSIFVG